MNLVDLVIFACSLAHPGSCGERHLLLEAHGSLAACMRQAPPVMAQWAGEHPDLRIARWHCDWPERGRSI